MTSATSGSRLPGGTTVAPALSVAERKQRMRRRLERLIDGRCGIEAARHTSPAVRL
ncbi:hypothetical protein [Streptomyces sp. NPDC090036]|uniref:hypothetical protein n=1 Tax=Streptomyces sp. NPDC090036 TaxID=3365926 RepID=UPI0038024909